MVNDKMEYYVGAKNQTKDSFGRWENGKIKQILGEGVFEVHFYKFGDVGVCKKIRWPLGPRQQISGKKYINFLLNCALR